MSSRQLPGGNRRQAWSVSVETDGKVDELFLRLDPRGSRPGADPYTLAREASICRALAPHGLPTPQVIAVDPERDAVLMRRIPGEAAFYRLSSAAEKQEIAREFIAAIARLHLIDPKELRLSPLPAINTISWHVRQELHIWEGMYRESGRVDPMIELGLRWLRDNVPEVSGEPVLVQGDTGPGNFLFADGRLLALIDWEFAHLGDPMEDLAWTSLRSAQEPVPDFHDLLARYEAAVGTPVEPDRLRYHRVFAELRVVIVRHRAAGDVAPAGDVGSGLLSRALHRRLFVEALADAAAIELQAPGPLPAGDSAVDWLYDSVLTQLKDDVVPLSSNPLVVSRAKGIARVVKYLRSERSYGAALEQAEREGLESLIGRRVHSVHEGQVAAADAIRSGSVGVEAALRHLGKTVAWETQVMRPAMGALADRHHAPLAARKAAG